ncbi:MarR family winged helix-turn-helix transcriptional regulator [Sulfuriferula sp. AH1]|uniref:MarR family winged helix-turn-helix transcriptional regulator n=1 Tax=Sulfuriferula sp. AH1 TaxID=1985873 RepID=UPI001CB89692|nr:MarR family winged helix-turn-helix transcriptional regulator [Sulfuriferula sp. AH1]
MRIENFRVACDSHSQQRNVMAGNKDSSTAQSTLRKFRTIFSAVRQHTQWVEAQCGISGAQLWVLYELAAQPGMRVSELANALAIKRSTASNLLDKIAQRGLIRRERGSPDQRAVHLYLTDAGVAVMTKAPQPAQGILIDSLSRLSPDELAALDQDLSKLMDLMGLTDSAGMEPVAGT